MSAANQVAYFGPVFNSLYSYDGRKLASDYELLREYATNDIVYACVNYNANAVAQVPFRLYTTSGKGQKAIRSHPSARSSRLTKARLRANPNLVKMIGPGDDVVEITEHPILDLIYGDNNGLNGFDNAFLTQIYKEIMGRAYWELETAGLMGMPTSFYVLKPQRTMPVRDGATGAVIGYKYQPDLRGTWDSLETDEVVDYRFPHPEDPYGWGMSPLKACFAQAELTAKFTKYGNDLMDNRARIDGMFIPSDDMGPEMARKAEDQFAQRFSNGRAGGVWFSPTKGTFVPTRYAPTDLGPMEVDKNTVSRVCRAFSIPEPLMSANESTFSNMDKALQFHAKFATTPRILQNEQRMNTGICPLFDDRLFLAADNPIPEDNEFELKKVQVGMTGKVFTGNEIREALGYDASDEAGMDDMPASDEELAQQQRDADAQARAEQGKAKDEPATKEKPVAKSFDTGRLIDINKAVASGDMPRGAAINAIVKAFDVTVEDARELVGFVKGVADAKEKADATTLSKAEGPHKFASTQINLTGDVAAKMLALTQSISADELAEDGAETEPHVTVKYGLHSDDPQDVRKVLKDAPPVALTMGDLSLFPATADRDYDVLKIDVGSPSLASLHDAIGAACENTETHPTYRPHATIAYLKAGMGAKYVGASPVSGQKTTATEIIFSARDGTRSIIPLGTIRKAEGKASGGGHWITIGGGDEGEGGGAHVFIEDGRIAKGPAGLQGKKLGELGHEQREKMHDARRTREPTHTDADKKVHRKYSEAPVHRELMDWHKETSGGGVDDYLGESAHAGAAVSQESADEHVRGGGSLNAYKKVSGGHGEDFRSNLIEEHGARRGEQLYQSYVSERLNGEGGKIDAAIEAAMQSPHENPRQAFLAHHVTHLESSLVKVEGKRRRQAIIENAPQQELDTSKLMPGDKFHAHGEEFTAHNVSGTTVLRGAGMELPYADTMGRIPIDKGSHKVGDPFDMPPEGSAKPTRFETGKGLTKEQRAEVLRSVGDSYKDLKAPKVFKGEDHTGDPIYGYAYSPEHMHTSDITGRKIRNYIKLPDGKRAHPSELYPEITQAHIDRAMAEEQNRAAQATQTAKEKNARVADTKQDANMKYNRTGRNTEGSYFAQNAEGKVVRVDGKFADDVKHFEGAGFKPITPAVESSTKTSGQQKGLLGEAFDGATVGSKSGNMFGDVTRDAAPVLTGLDKKFADVKSGKLFKASTADDTLDTLVDSHARLTPEQRKRRKQFLMLLLGYFAWQGAELVAGARADEPRFTDRLGKTLATGMRSALIESLDKHAPQYAETVERAGAEIDLQAGRMAGLINATTAKTINTATSGGQAIADAVDAIYLRSLDTRASAIEGDMTHVAEQIGNATAAHLAGKEVVWVTKDDERVCVDKKNPDGTIKYGCAALHGLVMKEGQEFAPGVRYPVIDTHGNCRCELEELPEAEGV